MTGKSVREVKDSPWHIGRLEKVAIKVDILPSWGTSPEAPVDSRIYDEDDVDKTADYMTGTADITGTVVTSKLIQGLDAQAGQKFRVVIEWTDSGNLLSCWGWLIVEPQ